MNNIKLLDCTLRDGSMAVDYTIAENTKYATVSALEAAGVDYIECGHLKSNATTPNDTRYSSPHDITKYIADKKGGKVYIAIMGNPSDISLSEIPERDSDNMIDGIRIAFNKDSISEALVKADEIQKRGYYAMLQAARTQDYTETELKKLIKAVNNVEPYWLGLVDTSGNTTPDRVSEILSVYERELSVDIAIDFHFHNNLQLAFANAITVIGLLNNNRNYILDASVFGMGSGAGNLPLELIMDYMNEKFGTEYNSGRVISLFDDYYSELYKRCPWGYNLDYYCTARVNCQNYYADIFHQQAEINHTDLLRLLNRLPVSSRANIDSALVKDIVARGI